MFESRSHVRVCVFARKRQLRLPCQFPCVCSRPPRVFIPSRRLLLAMWMDVPAALHRQTLLMLILCGILYKFACAKASDCQAVVEAVASARKARVSAIAMTRIFLVADRMFAKTGVAVAAQHIIDDKAFH